MYITRLRLIGYKRLMLSLINHFEYTPVSSLQLIIGRNGSGKSSVMFELTPLPSHHSHFIKGGSKLIECTHRGKLYILNSIYEQGTGKHSFITVDNGKEEEHNPGGTITVQKELVKREFGLTRELHELLVGITTFSGLSTTARRDLLTEMMPVNMDYVFTVYNKVKTSQRDLQGVIKHLTKRMVNENQDIPDTSFKVNLQKEIDSLTDRLTHLIQMRSADTSVFFDGIEHIKHEFDCLVSRGVRLLKNKPQPPGRFKFETLDDLDSIIKDHQIQQQLIQNKLEHSIAEFDKLTNLIPNEDVMLSENEVASLREQLTALQMELSKVNFSFDGVRFPEINLPMDRQPSGLLKQTTEEWIGIVQQIPDNSDGYYSIKSGEETKQQLQRIKRELIEIENKTNTLRGRLSRLKGCDTITCPACSHSFKPGVDMNEVERLEFTLQGLYSDQQSLELEEKRLKKYDEEFDEYLGYIRRFKALTMQSDSCFMPVWDYCIENKIMTTSPKNYLSDIYRWYGVVEAKIKHTAIQQQVDVIEHKLRFIDAIEPDLLHSMQDKKRILEDRISKLTDEIGYLSSVIGDLQTFRSAQLKYISALKDAIDGIKNAMDNLNSDVMYEYTVAVREEIKYTQLQLAQKQSHLTSLELKDSILADIQEQHNKVQELHNLDGLLLKCLSPTEGIIGRYLMGFMQSIVKLVNSVIAEIWTYPLEVMPSMVDGDDLNYNFPLNVNNGVVTPHDISRGSVSQVDIVNFAFKLLIMKCLDLQDHPLYLDEFGSSFDEQHRLNLIPFINKLITMGQISQVFYVNHYVELHGAFNQADIVVIDPINISLPEQYNQRVIIH